MESLAELHAREEEVGREWQWLHDALNTVARVRAEHADAAAFRVLQEKPCAWGSVGSSCGCRWQLWSERSSRGPPQRRAEQGSYR